MATPERDQALHALGAARIARKVASGAIRAVDIVAACLDQIERFEPAIHAWAHVQPDAALRRAAEVDSKVRSGGPLGPLAGVPIGIKDVFNTLDMPAQMGSPIWAGYTPGNDARVVHYLRMADAIPVGKTATAELAVHAAGLTENPHRPGYMPGTSSSGSAAAVAAYMVPVSLGTQTAGSIIRPASYCGVFGFKPSFGAVPRTGMLKNTDTLDTVGWFARNVADIELLFEACRVRGANFPLSERAFADPGRQRRNGRPWRIAFLRGPKWSAAETYTQRGVQGFAQLLSNLPEIAVEEIETPAELMEAHHVHGTIYERALAYYFRDEIRQHKRFSKQLSEVLERGASISLDEYQAALSRQSQIARVMERLFLQGYDAILDMAAGGEALEGLQTADRPDHALIWTLCGLPAVSLPVLTGPHGLPLGVQLVGRRYNDPLLFRLLDWLDDHGLLPDRTFPEPAKVCGLRYAEGTGRAPNIAGAPVHAG